MTTVLLARRLFDGLAAVPKADQAVVIDGETISWVGPRDTVERTLQNDPTVVDLGDATLIPGLIDAHVHLTLHPFEDLDSFPRQAREESPATLAARAIRNGQLCLSAGVTTVRDLGDVGLVTLAVRNAIHAGWVAGPNILASGYPITVTGGHLHWLGGPESDDIPSIRRAVRALAKAGVDWIKVMASGGLMTPGSVPTQAAYSEEELRALVIEANRLGLRVAAHCLCTAAVSNCARAGVATLEHCLLNNSRGEPDWDDGVADEIVRSGAWASITFNVLHRGYLAAMMRGAGVSDEDRGALKQIHVLNRRLWDKGARFIFSSDAGSRGTRFEEFGWGLVAAALAFELDAGQVLRCATSNAAAALGIEDRVGTIGPGLQADLVALEGNPWSDLRALSRVRTVWQSGRVTLQGGLVAGPK